MATGLFIFVSNYFVGVGASLQFYEWILGICSLTWLIIVNYNHNSPGPYG